MSPSRRIASTVHSQRNCFSFRMHGSQCCHCLMATSVISKLPIHLQRIGKNYRSFVTNLSSNDVNVDPNPNHKGVNEHRIKVVVAMSGGVDSSVAAHLLKLLSEYPSTRCNPNRLSDENRQSSSKLQVDVVGLHMNNWNALDEDSDLKENHCRKTQHLVTGRSPFENRATNSAFCEASEKDYEDAKSVAKHLSIPLQRVSFASDYWTKVFQPFVECLSLSITSPSEHTLSNTTSPNIMPNPDFGCNAFIKFGTMQDYAIKNMGADFIATGHYARLWHRNHNNVYSSLSSQYYLYEWMMETSKELEYTIHTSLERTPEAEWILNSLHKSKEYPTCPMLLSGADSNKDQSYFLSGVTNEAFRNVIFPLGHLMKGPAAEKADSKVLCQGDNSLDYPRVQLSVRDIAHKANIPTASKRDSMGICFIGKRNFGHFVSQYLHEPPVRGNFVDIDTGEILGRHEGLMHYTIGQGAKISGAPSKYFVCNKGGGNDVSNANAVFVCNNTHHPSLYTDELFVDFNEFNWIGLGAKTNDSSYQHVPYPLLNGQSISLLARTRHLQPLAPCTVTWNRDVIHHNKTSMGRLVVKFSQPMRAITPGQIIALYGGYDGIICLGGGPIKEVGSSFMERGVDMLLTSLHPAGHNDFSIQRNRHVI